MIPSDSVFADLCDKTGGNVSAIARALGVRRESVSRWIKESAYFQQCIDDAREASLDLAEDRAMMLIAGIPIRNDKGEIIGWQERPDSGLIKFKLATHGRVRGYGENLAITGADGGPIQVQRKINLDELSDEELDTLIANVEQRKSA